MIQFVPSDASASPTTCTLSAARRRAGNARGSRGEHIAILWPEYLDAILSGRKTIESRLASSRAAPYGIVAPGDRIFFRQRASCYRACATVERVVEHADLTPERVRCIRQNHNAEICGSPTYWRRKRCSRYATLIWLKDVEPCDVGPLSAPAFGRGWIVLRKASRS